MSTDDTPAIAQRLADVYIRDVHHGHAEPSRELAASRSSGDWILILDADERMSDVLKAELPNLVERDADGYWIRKVNFVGGAETGTILHFRLVRKSRVRFDPGPHGGATAVSENVEHFEQIGIIHEKSLDEQIFDDARYERMALEDDAPTSAKRNWLSHNHTLRQHRGRSIRVDLEALLPADASRVLVLGDIPIELPGSTLVRVDCLDPSVLASKEIAEDGPFDAAMLGMTGHESRETLRIAAGLVRPGGVIVGTAPAARNRRRIELVIAAVVSDGAPPDAPSAGGCTRRELLDELSTAGLDARWMRLVRDGWLNPVVLRPDGSGSVVESEDFLLKHVRADVAEELTAEEIVFAAVPRSEARSAECSIVVVALAGSDPQRFADALRDTQPQVAYELVVVQALPAMLTADATSVLVAPEASLAARWNAGARAATGELLVFASADSVPLAGWLDLAVQAFRSRPDTGAVGSKVIAQDGTIEHAGLVVGPDRIPYRLYQGMVAAAAPVNRPRIMPAVAADGMVTARARFIEVGGFDETLGEDLTDADFCMRLRTRGLPSVYAPAAVLRSTLRSVPGTRGDFRRSAREFAARWSPTVLRSDGFACVADGRDVHRQWNRSWRLPRPASSSVGGLPAIAWTSHFLEQGGYTEEAIVAVEALDDAGLYVAANPVGWERGGTPMPVTTAERLGALMERDLPDDFVHVAHIGADRFKRHPAALRSIGRTMFETDGLPPEWRDRCNLMDEVWVPSEHNLRTFANAGVDASKLHKVPETFDAELFQPGVDPMPVEGAEGFVFLSMFSWIPRKAWDVLLRAWFEEFGGHDDVTLLLKTDTALAPTGTDCRQEVESFVRGQLKLDLKKGPRIIVFDQPLESTDVPRLYRAADAFVLASHGEGWGRPYMEAMAMGLPTIATRWSGNLEFMNDDNSYLVGYKLVDALSQSPFHGQRWAQPRVSELRGAMRRVYEHRSEAAATGRRARADVLVSCRPELLVAAVRERIERDRPASGPRFPRESVAARSSRVPTDSSTADQGRSAHHRMRRGGPSWRAVVAAVPGEPAGHRRDDGGGRGPIGRRHGDGPQRRSRSGQRRVGSHAGRHPHPRSRECRPRAQPREAGPVRGLHGARAPPVRSGRRRVVHRAADGSALPPPPGSALRGPGRGAASPAAIRLGFPARPVPGRPPPARSPQRPLRPRCPGPPPATGSPTLRAGGAERAVPSLQPRNRARAPRVAWRSRDGSPTGDRARAAGCGVGTTRPRGPVGVDGGPGAKG